MGKQVIGIFSEKTDTVSQAGILPKKTLAVRVPQMQEEYPFKGEITMKSKRTLLLPLTLLLCMILLTAAGEELIENNVPAEPIVIGNGNIDFPFTVRDLEGIEIAYEIHTNCATVGQALAELGLIEGEEGPYGLYVRVVNGISLVWETDGHYWAFYINGEYAISGVDTTPITEGEAYAFAAE